MGFWVDHPQVGGTVLQPSAAVALEPLHSLRVSVTHHPGTSLFCLLIDALGMPGQGVPPTLRQAVRSAVPAGDMNRLAPLLEGYGFPDCFAPLAGPDLPSGLEHLREQDLSEVSEQARGWYESSPAPAAEWARVIERPAPYLAAFARVFSAIWEAYAVVWQRAQPLLWRETERVGTATVTGTLDVVLAGLANPCWRVEHDTLYCPPLHTARTPRREAGQGLVLAPLVCGSATYSISSDGSAGTRLSYPAPGLALIPGGDPVQPAADSLTILLGPARAAILRLAAHTPTVGEIATALSSGSATYHCRFLESAGLLTRRRRGREVRLHHTPRGRALLDLMS